MRNKITLLLFLTTISVFSQNKEAIYDIIAKETCECVYGKKIDAKNDDAEKIQLDFGLCIINSFSNHKNDFDVPVNLNFNDDEAMGQLGEEIAMKMVHHCPDFIIALGSRDDVLDAEEIPTMSMEVEYIETKKGDFQTITVKESNGRIHSLLILYFFENVHLITDGLVDKNDKLVVDYFEQEFYDPKVNDFRYYKVIQGIKKL